MTISLSLFKYLHHPAAAIVSKQCPETKTHQMNPLFMFTRRLLKIQTGICSFPSRTSFALTPSSLLFTCRSLCLHGDGGHRVTTRTSSSGKGKQGIPNNTLLFPKVFSVLTLLRSHDEHTDLTKDTTTTIHVCYECRVSNTNTHVGCNTAKRELCLSSWWPVVVKRP